MVSFSEENAECKSSLVDGDDEILVRGFTISIDGWEEFNEIKSIKPAYLSKRIGLANLHSGDIIALVSNKSSQEEFNRPIELISNSIYRVIGIDFNINKNDNIKFTVVLSESGAGDVLFIQFGESEENTGVWSQSRDKFIYKQLPSTSLVSDEFIAKKFDLNEYLIQSLI